ncbi:MAG TPA: flagellar biosynthetic protein FliR [Aliidongia sp.]|nr:flagellar biosynthetic protein FliR [Aliidongia sp.]
MHSLSFSELLPANAFVLLIVLCRVAAAVGLMPGFGEAYVTMRVRASLAVLITIVVAPLVADTLPPEPTNFLRLTMLIIGEIFIGAFMGLMSKVLLGSLETAGAIIATQSSLASAITFNPGAETQETLPAGLFGALALVLIFALNLHHMLLIGVVDSYQAFPVGEGPPFDDLSRVMIQLVSQGFIISLELAAPYIILGTLFYLALGLIGRVMPQLQVFYIALPLQIMGGLTMLALTLSASILWFLGVFQTLLTGFMRGP